MQEKIIIFLDNGSHAPHWIEIEAHGQLKQSDTQDINELTQAAKDKEVIVLIPTQDVLLTTIQLPKMNRSRLQQALPYALEEQLIADVDTLHFASGPHQENGGLPVAIVAKEKMRSWLEQLNAWQIQVDKMMPTLFAVPWEQGIWQVNVSDSILVRTGAYTGFACDQANVAELLNIALASAAVTPDHLQIENYTQQALAPLLTLSVNAQETMVNAVDWRIDLARHVAEFPFVNLLQGEYKTKKTSYPQANQMQRIMIYLGVAWLGLLFLYPTFSYWMLDYRVDTLNQEINTIYQRNFPDSSAVVAPKLRMEEKLRKLSGAAGDSRLLSWIGLVDQAVMEIPSIAISRLDYQNNQLSLTLTAASSDDFSKFTERLQNQGLQVNQQNVSLNGSRMNAVIKIK